MAVVEVLEWCLLSLEARAGEGHNYLAVVVVHISVEVAVSFAWLLQVEDSGAVFSLESSILINFNLVIKDQPHTYSSHHTLHLQPNPLLM